MELTVKKVNMRSLKNGICPRCGRKISHLVEKFKGRWADVYRCEGGHLYIKPIPEKEMKKGDMK